MIKIIIETETKEPLYDDINRPVTRYLTLVFHDDILEDNTTDELLRKVFKYEDLTGEVKKIIIERN